MFWGMGSVMHADERLSPRQEAFAHHVATGVSLSEAYRLAGFTASGEAVHVNASRLAKVAKVDARVRLIQAKVEDARQRALASTMIVTASMVSEMLATVFRNATLDKQHGAAATAAMGLAKVHGLLVDKTEDVTRRAARSPDAPIEIEVEHWLTEQQGLPSPANGAPLEPAQRGVESDHGPEPESPAESPETKASEAGALRGSDPSEPSKGVEKPDEVDRFIQ